MTTRRQVLLSACALAGASVLPRRSEAQDEARRQPASAAGIPKETVSLSDFEALARERAPRMAFEYISGGEARMF